jgi:hypothetical protein
MTGTLITIAATGAEADKAQIPAFRSPSRS